MPLKIIDIHPHIISTDTKRYPITPLGGKRSDWSSEKAVTFEQLITAMDTAGVEKAAIVHSSTTYGYDNSYLADCVSLQPNRFDGVFSVDIQAPDAPEKINYWVEKGLGGLRIFAGGSTMKQADWLDDPKTFPGWECAKELGISVCVQMFKEGLPQLMVLIKRFPQVKIIIDHLMMKIPVDDGPPYPRMKYVFDLARYDNVYLKMTPSNIKAIQTGRATPETFMTKLVKEFGASRIAWGSNYPVAAGTLAEIVNEARAVIGVLPEKDQEWIFSRTAQSLYPNLSDN